MKFRKQDIATLVFYYLGYSRIKNLANKKKGQPLTRIITFHDTPPVAKKNFEAMLQVLKSNTNVITLDDYLSGNLSRCRTNVVITFDDGYSNWVSVALPVLMRLGLPAIFFVSSGFIGLSALEEAEFVRNSLKTRNLPTGCLVEGQLRRIVEEGFMIGGHTVNHVNMAETYDTNLLYKEVVEDKKRLQAITGESVNYFSYPFGACANCAVNLVGLLKDAGYRAAVTTASGLNIASSNSYLLKRELTGLPMSLPVFRARVSGAYDAVNCLKVMTKKLFRWTVKNGEPV